MSDKKPPCDDIPPPPTSKSQQSPIDLCEPTYYVEGLASRLAFDYDQPVSGTLTDGHELHLDPHSTAKVDFDGLACPLRKLHFHRPSEHTLEGKPAFMEVHLVHEIPSSPGVESKLLVVGVFIDEHTAGSAATHGSRPHQKAHGLSVLVKAVFGQHTEERFERFDLLDLLPEPELRQKFWRYEGSLTTPGFGEHVSWIVLLEHATLDELTSKELAESPKSARCVQPRSRRFVLRSFR